MTEVNCPDCGCETGSLHELYCLKERCPFCGNQLASCGCMKTVLELSPEQKDVVDAYEDDSEEPLRSILRRWEKALARKGRVPYSP